MAILVCIHGRYYCSTAQPSYNESLTSDEWAHVFVLAIAMILMSGPIFGFSAIKDLLVTRFHAFEDSCQAADTSLAHCQNSKLETLAFLSFWTADASMIFFGELNVSDCARC